MKKVITEMVRVKMIIDSTGLILFSPTQTTKKIIEGIAQGLQVTTKQYFDLTLPDTIAHPSQGFTQDLAIIGAPVYAGRLPSVMLSRFKQIKGNGRPAVIVVVYGNRAYEDALIELRNVAIEIGFKPIAAGAFIGEHSYSTSDLPIAKSRPDADDMATAHKFGKEIRKKFMTEISNTNELLQVPGNFPYKEIQMLSGVVPSVNEALCLRCRKCVPVCPTVAIDKENPMNTAKDLCIRCCACVKACPSYAKLLDDPRIKQAAEWLYANFSVRKEPEIYL
ncbi:4Fe-4S binding protein [Geobacter sp. OR-1]|uniref:4Fe-4S binding protein n=1 Tax=Geobacter sp. OR-1 TaxID=1266765 RepID=UPI001ED9C3F5|nr:4Fe-4S binding protein [Geobacter sp. OR-1]